MITMKDGTITFEIPAEGLTIVQREPTQFGRTTQIYPAPYHARGPGGAARATSGPVVPILADEGPEDDQPPSVDLTGLREEIELLREENSELLGQAKRQRERVRKAEFIANETSEKLKRLHEKCEAVVEAGDLALTHLHAYRDTFEEKGALAGFTERDEIGGVAGRLDSALTDLRYRQK